MLLKIEKTVVTGDGRTIYGIRSKTHERTPVPSETFTMVFSEELMKKYNAKEGDMVQITFEADRIVVNFLK